MKFFKKETLGFQVILLYLSYYSLTFYIEYNFYIFSTLGILLIILALFFNKILSKFSKK